MGSHYGKLNNRMATFKNRTKATMRTETLVIFSLSLKALFDAVQNIANGQRVVVENPIS
jgi:hypothetical protein